MSLYLFTKVYEWKYFIVAMLVDWGLCSLNVSICQEFVYPLSLCMDVPKKIP